MQDGDGPDLEAWDAWPPEEAAYRRDPAVTAPRSSKVERDPRGVPYLMPHGTLLSKAKAARAKDEADLRTCLPRMSAGARAWLQHALEQTHPGHPWIARLA